MRMTRHSEHHKASRQFLAHHGPRTETRMRDAPQAYLAAVFCLASVITTLNANGLPLLEFDNERYRANLTAAAALGALPGTAVFFTLLRAPTPTSRARALNVFNCSCS